ncbi:MAG: 50S ribosomal protein L23 [Apibacter sp.]|jgi:large subunit ribosomal protein L23|uniref:Large ribosomal subunit protein uL23 n=1 Tax=Apibacter mensalis TaxID=1586267 RepID=A0A0X3AP81_9FLAO|nr:50S ribosomal protein L23 [Apibacter mensalis]MCO6565429.1 50S ribosomal protein L23 [Apibacter sp.]CVK16161.1 large subunit ribosomal protein L23 [Apibacter mensalis]
MSVLIKPVISEKANEIAEKRNRYTFLVDTKSNKSEIKYAVEQAYGVSVVAVRTLISAPVVKSKYTKTGLQVGKTNKLKKAMVDIQEGQTIDVFGNI